MEGGKLKGNTNKITFSKMKKAQQQQQKRAWTPHVNKKYKYVQILHKAIQN